jgi:hypothetical protein
MRVGRDRFWMLLIPTVAIMLGCFTDDDRPPIGDTFRRASGTVTDSSTSLPLSGVTCSWADSLPPYETHLTDSSGAYSVRIGGSPLGLPAIGHLSFSKEHYRDLTIPAVTIFPDTETQHRTYDVRLVRLP